MNGHKLVHILDHVTNAVIILFFLPFLALGIYSLWDNAQSIKAADTNEYEQYKPTDRLSFKELQKINPDVFGWITINGTHIDYPLVQGQDNSKYINTDVLGKFSLAGSIFMDYRNHKDFSDPVSILYGHNIEDHKMFGELSLYKNKSYFDHHLKGKLYYKGKWHKLQIFAYVHTDAYKQGYYNPHIDRSSYLHQVKRDASHYKSVPLSSGDHYVTCSTCTNADTNGRYLLIGKIEGEIR